MAVTTAITTVAANYFRLSDIKKVPVFNTGTFNLNLLFVEDIEKTFCHAINIRIILSSRIRN